MPACIEHRGGHVDFVQVGPLFAVHLDGDEVAVQKFRHVLLLEAFMLHDVTPVTGGVTDAEEDQLVFLPRPIESFLAPGVPVHRVVCVLEKIRTRFVNELVGVFWLHRPLDHSRGPSEGELMPIACFDRQPVKRRL